MLLTGLAIDYNKQWKFTFGTNVQVHTEGDSSLSIRTSGAIALCPTGNEQGGNYFLSLHSDKKINRFAWTELPMLNEVIEQVHRFSKTAEKYKDVTFTDVEGNILQDQIDGGDDIQE